MKQFFSSCNKLWATVVLRNREKKLSPVVIHLSFSFPKLIFCQRFFPHWSKGQAAFEMSFHYRLHTVPPSLFSEGTVAHGTGVEC